MHELAVRITDYFINNAVTKKDNREQCIYGFEMILCNAVGYGTFLCLGLFFGKIVPTILFLITFDCLRKRTGGFHMKTELGCYIVSVIQYLIIIWLGTMSEIWMPIVQISVVLISIIIIVPLAPLNHPNWNLDADEVKLCKKSVVKRLSIISFVVIVSVIFGWVQAYIPYITMGIGLDAGALLLGKILKQEVTKDEEENFETVR